LEVSEEMVEVKATNGDTNLGGDNVDDCLIEWLIEAFKKENGIDVSSQKMVVQRLKEAAEKAKIELSSANQTEINLPFLTADATGPKHLQVNLSRLEFERMIDPIVERTLAPCRQAIKDSDLAKSEIDEIILVGGSTRIPLVQKKVEELFGKATNRSVNPDEVVALGAAIQGGVLAGDVTSMLLLDVTPLSLGIETLGGVMTVLIPRNTTIPVTKKEIFSTAADNQTAVDVMVFQGERQMAKDNQMIGNFRLDGIPSAPRGVPQIEVKFDIDANGILSVGAADKATGKEQQITIEASSGLNEKDIDRMVNEAKEHEAADQDRREFVEARNNLDNAIYQTEKTLGEHGDKLPADEKEKVEAELTQAKEALDSDEIDLLKSSFESLTTASHKLAEVMYQSEQAEGGAEAGGDAGASDSKNNDNDDVIDAEYSDVDA
jgi:molecular chaperone DnaK